MGNLLKYLIISLVGVLLSATGGKDGSAVAGNLADRVRSECVQYQHSVFEPANTVFVNINESNFSSVNTIRVLKKHKRHSGGHKYNSTYLSNGKHCHSRTYIISPYKTAIHTPYLAQESHKLVLLGKLII